MPLPSVETLKDLLSAVTDPETGRPLAKVGQLGEVTVQEGGVQVTLLLTSWSAPLWDETRASVERMIRAAAPEASGVEVRIQELQRPAERQGQLGVPAKSVVAVGSGKGGVGKSTVAAMLALALREAGCKVGLMDADVYGPSIPHLLGAVERPTVKDERLQPVEKDGLKLMSMGFLVPKEEAVIWRGPMLHGAITQFLRDTDWGDLDWLVIDMPPGTGDIALTLSQSLPLTGAVVVCTPQEVALLDAVKAVAMFRKVNIPVLGMVENMSFFLCPSCSARHEVFGSGGARAKAQELGVPLLGEAPLIMGVRERGDAGQTAGNLTDPASGPLFREMAARLVRGVAQARDAAPPMPTLPVL